jgi:hypothetical protein
MLLTTDQRAAVHANGVAGACPHCGRLWAPLTPVSRAARLSTAQTDEAIACSTLWTGLTVVALVLLLVWASVALSLKHVGPVATGERLPGTSGHPVNPPSDSALP